MIVTRAARQATARIAMALLTWLHTGLSTAFSRAGIRGFILMALDQTSLRKLLKLMFLPVRERRSELRKNIREEMSRLTGIDVGGGDFYGPFWADAKAHVFGALDLHDAVDARIAVNGRRVNLYGRLRDGFLLWWTERRRWTNEPFRQGGTLKTRFRFPGLEATVKIDNILSVKDGNDGHYAVYPYFAPDPALSEEAASLGLWLLAEAFPNIPPNEFRILDIIRGRTFSLDRIALRGDEGENFRRRFSQLMSEWDTLKGEYE
jgi:hypothetical protein